MESINFMAVAGRGGSGLAEACLPVRFRFRVCDLGIYYASVPSLAGCAFDLAGYGLAGVMNFSRVQHSLMGRRGPHGKAGVLIESLQE